MGSYDNSVSGDEDVFFDVNAGALTVDATAQFSDETLYIDTGDTFAPGGTVTVGGSWINAGTFTHGSSTVTLNGTTTGYVINANGASGAFATLTLNGSGGAWTVSTTDMTVATTLNVTTGTLNLGSRTTTFSATGSSQLSVSGTLNVDTSTIAFTGNGATTVPARTYHNLTLAPTSGSPTYSFSTGTTTTNDLTVGGGAAMTANANPSSITLDVNGNFTLSVNATFQAPGSGKSFTIGGNFDSPGTLTDNSGTVTFDATDSGNTIDGDFTIGSDDFYNLTFNGSGGSWTIDTDTTVRIGHSFHIVLGSVTANDNLYVAACGTTSDGAGTLTMANGTAITLNCDSHLDNAGNWTLYDLNADSGGTNTNELSGNGTLTINNALSTTTGTILNLNSKTIVFTATGSSHISNSGTINAESSTIRFTGNGATTIPSITYNNLQVYPGGASVTHTLPASLTVNGNLDLGGNSNAASTVITAATNNTAMTVKGNLTLCAATCSNQMTFTKGSGTLTWSPVGTVSWTDNNPTTKQDVGTISITAGTSTPVINLGSSVAASTVTVAASHTLGLNGANTLTLTGTTGTPLSVSGSLTASTGTIAYTGDNGGGNTTIANLSYYNLTLSNGSETFAMPSTGTVTNDLLISSGTFLSSSGTLTIGGNFTNNGTFTHNSGTVAFNDNTKTSALSYSAATTWNNLSVTTAGKALQFDNADQTNVSGTLTLTGGNCTTGRVFLDSTVNDDQWAINATGSVSISYVDVEDSNAVAALTANDSTAANGNNTNWTVNGGSCLSGVTVTGTVYSNEGSTAITSGPTVRVKVNGTGSYAATANGSGVYSIASVPVNAGDVVTIFLDGATENAVAVTRAADTVSSISVNLYQNRVILRHEDSGPLTNANLDSYDYANESSDGDIGFTVGSGALTLLDGWKAIVWTGDTFTPGGSVTTDPSSSAAGVDGDLVIQSGATLSMASNALSIGGDFTNSGTFSKNSTQNTTFTATATGHVIEDGSSNFGAVTFNGSGGGWSFGSGVTLSDDLTVTTGTLSGTQDVTVNGGDVTGDGTISLSSGTLSVDGPSGNFGGNTAWSFNNLSFTDNTPYSTTTATGAGGVSITGTLSINVDRFLNAGSKTWTLSGTGTPLSISGSFAPASSTWVYTGSTATVTATTFHHLTLGGTGTYALPASSWGATGNISITNGATLSATGGTLTLSPTGTKTLTDNNATKQNLGPVVISGGSSTPVIALGSSITLLSITIDSGHELDMTGSNTLIVTGAQTSFVNNGTFRYRTSTVRYTASSAFTPKIAAANMGNASGGTNGYYNLEAMPIGDRQQYLGTAASQTIGVANNLTLGNGTNTGAIDGGFYDPNILVAGTLTVASNAQFNTGSGTLTLSGSGTPLVNTGTFVPDAENTVVYTSSSGISALATNEISTANNAFYNLTVNGTGTFTAGINFDVQGDLTVTSGTLAGTPSTTVNGHFTGNGTVNMTGGTVTMSSTTSKNLGGSSAWTFYNLTGSGVSGTTVASGSGGITVSRVLTNGANHTLDAGSKSWTLSGTTGTPFVNNGTFTPSTSTIAFTGNNAGGDTTVPALTYYNLTLNNASETYLLAGTTTLTNDLTITAGTLDVVSGQNYALSIGGSWSNAGTFTPRSGTVTFTATSGTKTINNGSSQFYNLVLNGSGGTFQPSGNAMTVGNDLTVTAGTLSGTLGVTVNGGDVTGAGTISMTGGTFLIDAAGNFGSASNWTFHNLTFGDGTGTATSTATGAGTVTVSNVLTIAANQTFAAGSKSYTLSGSATPMSRSGVLDAGTSTFTYTAAGTALASVSTTFYDLVIAGNVTAGNSFFAANGLTVSSGTFTVENNDMTIGNSANSNSGSLKVASGATYSQSASGTTTLLSSASGSNCIGSTGSSCSGTQGAITFGNLTIGNGSTTFTTTLGATTPSVTIAGTLDITANATFNAGAGSTMTLSGSGTPVTRSGTFTKGTSTLVFTSASGTSGLFSAAMTGSNALYNLTINQAGQSFVAGASALEIANALAVTAGTLNLDTNDPAVDVNGDVSINGTLSASNSGAFTIAGSFTNAGTFTHNSGTVTFDTTSTSTVTGATTFHNFTSTAAGKTIRFQKATSGSPVFTFAGTFTITGSSGNNISLQSDTAASQWLAHFNGAQSTVTYATISDSGCNAGSADVAASATNTNAGNNGACWLFVVASTQGGNGFRIEGGGGGGGTAQSGGSGQSGTSGGAEGGSGGGGAAQGGGSGHGGGGGGTFE